MPRPKMYCFGALGYPFDIPPLGADLLTYCVLVYHLPLLIAFSLQQHTKFVWGGCMLFRLQNLVHDKYGLTKVSSLPCMAAVCEILF